MTFGLPRVMEQDKAKTAPVSYLPWYRLGGGVVHFLRQAPEFKRYRKTTKNVTH